MENIVTLDMTLFIQLVNFLITVVVLNFLLIKPVRDQIAERGSFSAAQTADSEKFTAQASDKLSAYEKALGEARAKASLARETIKADGLAREKQLLETAHSEASACIASSKEQTAKETKKALQALHSQVNAFAVQAMNKILG